MSVRIIDMTGVMPERQIQRLSKAPESAGIKLGPGLDRDLIPDDVEAQWVSADGSVVELVLWSGELARPGIRRSALVMQAGETHELTAAADADAPSCTSPTAR